MSNVSVSRRAGLPHRGQGDVLPGRMVVERIARPREIDILRQDHRQLRIRHRHRAAGLAMDDRDRAAPVALPAHAPVAQPPVHHAACRRPAPPARRWRGASPRRPAARRGNPNGRSCPARHRPRPSSANVAGSAPGGSTTGGIGRPYSRRELEIPLVMRRAAEDRAGAVFHQHEIRDPHRIGRIRQERVLHPQAGVVAELLRRSRSPPRWCPAAGTPR